MACLFTREVMETHFGPSASEGSESVKGLRYMDGSLEIDYEFEDSSEELRYVNCMLAVEGSSSDAEVTFQAYWQGSKIGTAFGGDGEVEYEDADEIFRWGNESHFSFLTSEGERYGFLFVARKDERVFFLIVANALAEDTERATGATPRITADSHAVGRKHLHPAAAVIA